MSCSSSLLNGFDEPEILRCSNPQIGPEGADVRHVEDKGIRHAYIKPSSPQLNGKVERTHRSDSQEFYQLLSYKGDVDLKAKLVEWERFYNLARPHGAHNRKTPCEALREKP
jgi:transposase InsO family protein